MAARVLEQNRLAATKQVTSSKLGKGRLFVSVTNVPILMDYFHNPLSHLKKKGCSFSFPLLSCN